MSKTKHNHRHSSATRSIEPGMTEGQEEDAMNPLYAFSPVCEQTLRALARYPQRTAFAWPGGSLTYQGATDLIGRMQATFMRLDLEPGSRIAFLSANRADTWCAGVAAQLARL